MGRTRRHHPTVAGQRRTGRKDVTGFPHYVLAHPGASTPESIEYAIKITLAAIGDGVKHHTELATTSHVGWSQPRGLLGAPAAMAYTSPPPP